MKHLTVTGYVLKKINYAEADCIFVIFTKELGKISAIAKGVRKIKSRMGGHLDFFAKIRFDLHKSTSSELFRINNAEMLELYKIFVQDLSFIHTGFNMMQLVNNFTQKEEQSPRIFDLISKSFLVLDKSKKNLEILLAFQIKFLSMSGFLPVFNKCLKCKTKLFPAEHFINLSNLSIVCNNCGQKSALYEPISFPHIKILNYFQKATLEQIIQIKLSKKDVAQFLSLIKKTITQIQTS